VPPGFAHGYYVMSDWAEFLYKATDYYAPEWERSIRWNDPAIGIEWPLKEGFLPTLSNKRCYRADINGSRNLPD
jgi:dTDP-4-dehydrorhamnose 3,5-epimerase